jgi:hypothetical protein
MSWASGPTLLQQIIAEGISSAFDIAAFPGAPNPWDRAISRSQECVLWKKAQPLLAGDHRHRLGRDPRGQPLPALSALRRRPARASD